LAAVFVLYVTCGAGAHSRSPRRSFAFIVQEQDA
jgi:hypothetical protein